MKNILKLDDTERERILEMHKTAINNHYLSEQVTQPAGQTDTVGTEQGVMIDGKRYIMDKVVDRTTLDNFINWGGKGPEITLSMLNDANPGSNFTGFPEKIAGDQIGPYAKVGKFKGELDLIAQKFTTQELCQQSEGQLKKRASEKGLSLSFNNSLNVAKNRAYILGWCAA